MNYAWIENGVVTNLIYLLPSNAAEFPHAVPLGGVPPPSATPGTARSSLGTASRC